MDQTHLLMQTAALAARLLLESGAETSRAEETVSFLCRPFAESSVQVLALPTGVFFSLTPIGTEKICTQVVRITRRTADLSLITKVNALSRAISSGKLPLEEGFRQLKALSKSRAEAQRRIIELPAAVLTSGFFTLLQPQAGWKEFLVAAFCGLLSRLSMTVFQGSGPSSAFYCLISSALTALIALFAALLFPACDPYAIIAGAMMPLFPGLAMTNAVRDTVNGDLVSGTARAAEALLRAVSLAAGAGIVAALLGGGVL